jgi:hypothetical protein
MGKSRKPLGPVTAADVIMFIETVCFVPEGKPRGRGQAGGVFFVSLMSPRSSGLLMSRTVLTATRV